MYHNTEPQQYKLKYNTMSTTSPESPGINEQRTRSDGEEAVHTINFGTDRFPYCIVWTPIPVLSWLLPIIGHMGICMSTGVIRDFAGPYFVSEDNMAFGRPTKYLKLSPSNAHGERYEWDEAVSKASVLYGTRMHNLFCDNCHSHVATALCGMRYKDKTNWNMIILAFWMFFCGRYVGFIGFIKTWLPFVVIVTLSVMLAVYF